VRIYAPGTTDKLVRDVKSTIKGTTGFRKLIAGPGKLLGHGRGVVSILVRPCPIASKGTLIMWICSHCHRSGTSVNFPRQYKCNNHNGTWTSNLHVSQGVQGTSKIQAEVVGKWCRPSAACGIR